MNQLPERKRIRLQNYDYSRNGAYYITVCTHRRQALFGSVECGSDPAVGAHLRVRPHRPDELIVRWLGELEHKYDGVTVDYFIVMPDHVHFILLTEGANADIPKMVQWFKTQTTNEYIRRVKSGAYPSFDKHIWQRGYYDHVIRDSAELYEKRRYISENPARWAYRYSQEKNSQG